MQEIFFRNDPERPRRRLFVSGLVEVLLNGARPRKTKLARGAAR
jgi:hypothetical protein